MIKTIGNNVDQDLYVYESKLDFGKEFGQKILDLVLTTPDIFPSRHNYKKTLKDVLRNAGKEKTREILKRMDKFHKLYPDQDPIEFHQYFFTEELKTGFMSIIPDWLKTFTEEGPDFMLQIGSQGQVLYPHKGHRRTCSLFFLLQSDGQETRWYRNTQDFEVIDALRIPDIDCVEQVISSVIQPGKWYVFNHREWHSVHKYVSDRPRINIGIDFNDISATELVKLVKQHEG